MIDLAKVVFICNHYRRSFYFEQTLRDILDLGGRIIIQNTGGTNLFGPLAQDIRDRCRYVEAGNCSYDSGMSRFKNSGIVPADAEIICLLDNDCFITQYGVQNSLPAYLQEFVDGGYDFCCHTIGEDVNKGNYAEGKQIALAPPLTFTEPGADNMPDDIRSSRPYGFENSYLLYSKRAWDGMTPHDLSHHRRVVYRMHALGAKMGTHRVPTWQWGYTQWDADFGWHHVGNLFPKYLQLEANQLDKWNPESQFDLFRVGYFNAQIRAFDPPVEGRVGHTIYPPQILRNLCSLNARMGGGDEHVGQEKALAVWDDLHKAAGFYF